MKYSFFPLLLIFSISAFGDIQTTLKKVERQIQESNSEFSQIKEEMEKISHEIEEFSKKKKLTSKKLEKINKKLFKLKENINSLSFKYQSLTKTLKKLKQTLLDKKNLKQEITDFTLKNSKNLYFLKLCDRNFTENFIMGYPYCLEKKINFKLIYHILKQAGDIAQQTQLEIKTLEGKMRETSKKTEELKTTLSKFYASLNISKKEKERIAKSLSEYEKKQIKLTKELKEKKRAKENLEKLLKKFLEKKKNLMEELEKEKNFLAKKGFLPKPVSGEITSRFGKQPHPNLPTYVVNNGIKIHSGTSTVTAVSNGVVSFAGPFKGWGKTVIIEHGGGFYTVTANLNKVLVKEKMKVKKGQAIGSCVPGDEIYFEIRRGIKAIDPEEWFSKE